MDFNTIISAKNGALVDGPFSKGGHRTVRVRCAESHEWDVRIANLTKGSWCPQCYNTAHSATGVPIATRRRGGRAGNAVAKLEGTGVECTDDTPPATQTDFGNFRCAAGHEFETTVRKIIAARTSKCVQCAIAGFAPVRLAEDYPGDLNLARRELKWSCDMCGGAFTATYQKMCSSKKGICRVCESPPARTATE